MLRPFEANVVRNYRYLYKIKYGVDTQLDDTMILGYWRECQIFDSDEMDEEVLGLMRRWA